MTSSFEPLLAGPPFALSQKEKEALLLPLFMDLTAYHEEACPAYRKIAELAFPRWREAQTLAELPYLPLSLFKQRRLLSVPESDVRVTLRSSGTSGARKSRVDLDGATAQLAAKTLASTLKTVIGNERLPMLIVDTPAALKANEETEEGIGARASAILGLMPFGKDHAFVVREDLSLDEAALAAFLKKYGGQPFLIYGFTYLLWQKLLPFCEAEGCDFSNATLLHSGGWKVFTREYIDNETFRARFQNASRLSRVINFYGMAEMPGAIFLENADGLLYVPAFAEVIIRDPADFSPVEDGRPGVIQIMNLVPRSYPGHSLLTEDVGVVHAVDTGESGWNGKAIRFLGRAPKATPRGCSDALAACDTRVA